MHSQKLQLLNQGSKARRGKEQTRTGGRRRREGVYNFRRTYLGAAQIVPKGAYTAELCRMRAYLHYLRFS